MKTEYSADDIASARSLQTFTYIYTSMAAFWTYDYVCSIHEEWTFQLRSRWTKVKGLYIVARYTPFLLFASYMYMNFSSNENSNQCQTINTISACFSVISLVCAEFFFILRTYVLWNKSRIVLVIILTTSLVSLMRSPHHKLLVDASVQVFLVASIFVAFFAQVNAPFETSVIPGITGCYQSSGSFELFIPFLLLFVLELGLLAITLIRAIQCWRTTRNSLYAVLLKHNIFYYACGLFFSAVNIPTSLLLQYAYQGMFQDFQIVILAILATRMHLHLWHLDQHFHDSDQVLLLSDLSSAGRTA
ncbi:hypothetical protein AZE42_10833 [Rhizopogon vesiculosus]|uniref:DUF6533 domain-containing protein n=1 Tax=Rhizopogon vesiculosus TaxID=180088 RepID=A0A1J8QVY4_9AGAM|nr:hypothetical protein AZE42_10833 [Rhizopogon vesiculosus]